MAEEDAVPWDDEDDTRAADHNEEGARKRRPGVKRSNNHTSSESDLRERDCLAEQLRSSEERQVHTAGVTRIRQVSEEQGYSHNRVENETADGRQAAKRKAANANRHHKRNRRRAAGAPTVGPSQSPRELQLIVEELANNRITVPWDHRGMLGHTRGGD